MADRNYPEGVLKSTASSSEAVVVRAVQASVQSTGLESAIDCWRKLDGRNRLILSRFGRVLSCSSAVRNFLCETSDFHFDDGQFSPAAWDFRKNFAERIRTVGNLPETYLLPMIGDDSHWLCRMVAFRDPKGETMVALSIEDARSNAPSEWVDFRQLLGLTEAESDILTELMNCQTPQDIAISHHLSINTVRTHVRHIYEKIGVTNVQELWKRLRGYRIR